ncbi:hypothetical protein [Bacillus cereus group sp. TH152-1LC]|uniref:hypothetical protein n=1 Tax=Bacillus cereus group sp. TH152-1LC TaxID=3018060 RepID=UPI0022E41D2A|nr:hypothetical protein [Bacillus cereus group sp. TH152-1LC]MDA1675353.1 hypothetical protein [Bacillus cereus group sp. TH152-1LC]
MSAANMKKFTAEFSKESKYVGVVIGDKQKATDGTLIIVTSIIRVTVEKDGIYVEGVGMPTEF